jgi:hypothetical protein
VKVPKSSISHSLREMADVWLMFCAGALHFLQSLPPRMKPQPPTTNHPNPTCFPRYHDYLPITLRHLVDFALRIAAATPSIITHDLNTHKITLRVADSKFTEPLAVRLPASRNRHLRGNPWSTQHQAKAVSRAPYQISKQFVDILSSQQFCARFFPSTVLPYFECRK